MKNNLETLRMHKGVAQTVHLSIIYIKQTDGGFPRREKIGCAPNLNQD
ncbi:hypothetical protein ACLHDF_31570 [Priestia aryabhattai]